MGYRPRRQAPLEGGSRRANINLGAILGAAGVGGQAANAGFVSPDAGPGAVPYTYQGDPSEYLTSAQNVPYANQGFMGRALGQPDLNADYRANLLDKQLGSYFNQKDLGFADQLQAGAERRRNFADYSGGATESEVDPALVEQFKRGYAAAKSEQALTAALAGVAQNRLVQGTATRGEELGQLQHPFNKELTTEKGLTDTALARGRRNLVPDVLRAEGSTLRATPYKQAADLFQGSTMNLGDGRILSFDLNTGNRNLTTIPDPQSVDLAKELGQPAPEINTQGIDNNFVTLSDGSKLPLKMQNQGFFNDILGNSATFPGKVDEVVPAPAPLPERKTPSRFKTLTAPETPVLEGSGLVPSAFNVPELGRRIGKILRPEPSNMQHALDFKISPKEILNYWRGIAPEPGVVGPQVSPALPLPFKKPNYR